MTTAIYNSKGFTILKVEDQRSETARGSLPTQYYLVDLPRDYWMYLRFPRVRISGVNAFYSEWLLIPAEYYEKMVKFISQTNTPAIDEIVLEK